MLSAESQSRICCTFHAHHSPQQQAFCCSATILYYYSQCVHLEDWGEINQIYYFALGNLISQENLQIKAKRSNNVLHNQRRRLSVSLLCLGTARDISALDEYSHYY